MQSLLTECTFEVVVKHIEISKSNPIKACSVFSYPRLDKSSLHLMSVDLFFHQTTSACSWVREETFEEWERGRKRCDRDWSWLFALLKMELCATARVAAILCLFMQRWWAQTFDNYLIDMIAICHSDTKFTSNRMSVQRICFFKWAPKMRLQRVVNTWWWVAP